MPKISTATHASPASAASAIQAFAGGDGLGLTAPAVDREQNRPECHDEPQRARQAVEQHVPEGIDVDELRGDHQTVSAVTGSRRWVA
jgi:hypothetical protein